jgi:hypothetical protein
LADTYVHPLAFPVARVRTGKPSEQILHEAHTENVDLIILPTFGASRWNRLMHFWKPPAPLVSPLGEKLIRDATCAVFVVLARKTLDCARVWGRLVENSDDVPVAIFPSQPKLLGAASCRRLQPGSSLMTRYTRS